MRRLGSVSMWEADSKVSIQSYLLIIVIVDLMYEIQTRALLTGAKSTYSLILPTVMELSGNICAVTFVWLYPSSPSYVYRSLTIIALRELMEVVTSLGVMTVVSGIYYFNRFDYFMIDVITPEAFRNAWIMACSSSVIDVVLLIILDFVVRKVWKGLSLFDLGLSFLSAIGLWRIFLVFFCCIGYIFGFMNYHFGCDYFFRFEWMTEENLAIADRNDGTPSWCEIRQMEGKSCYNWE